MNRPASARSGISAPQISRADRWISGAAAATVAASWACVIILGIWMPPLPQDAATFGRP